MPFTSSAVKHEPEYALDQCNLSICVISEQGELKPEAPIGLAHNVEGGCKVSVSFASSPGLEYRLFVRNYGVFDASADIMVDEFPLGKWLIAREPKAWHNIGCGFVLRFPGLRETDFPEPRQPETTSIEIQFRYLLKLPEGAGKAGFTPVRVRRPTSDDGPGYIALTDDTMLSKFEMIQDTPFLNLVLSFKPPEYGEVSMTAPIVPTPPASETPASKRLPALETGFVLPTNHAGPRASEARSPVGSTSSESSSAVSSHSISEVSVAVSKAHLCSPELYMTRHTSIKMSDIELDDELSEHKSSHLLVPARLSLHSWSKVPIDDFCRRYQLPDDILPVLAEMNIKSALNLSRLYLRDLSQHGMAFRSVNMLRVAVARFSSDSKP
ncbi:hypothetical protein BC834DRAFT_561527 [Gloeopeniophorella convolvens]|nr:hypothetical protein BC834DRAFT_561527 [Gloeopeniophorella convolvens]